MAGTFTEAARAREVLAELADQLGEGWALREPRDEDAGRWAWVHGPGGETVCWYAGRADKVSVDSRLSGQAGSRLALEASRPLAQRVRRVLNRARKRAEEVERRAEATKAERKALGARLLGVASTLAGRDVATEVHAWGGYLVVGGTDLRVYLPDGEDPGRLVLSDGYHSLGSGDADRVAAAIKALDALDEA